MPRRARDLRCSGRFDRMWATDLSIARRGLRREMHVKLHHARVDLKRGTWQNAFIGRRRICIDYPDKGQISPDITAMHAATQMQNRRTHVRRGSRSFLGACVMRHGERGTEVAMTYLPNANAGNDKDFLFSPSGPRAPYILPTAWLLLYVPSVRETIT